MLAKSVARLDARRFTLDLASRITSRLTFEDDGPVKSVEDPVWLPDGRIQPHIDPNTTVAPLAPVTVVVNWMAGIKK